MRVTQNAHVNLRKIHAHYARVFCEQVRRSRIEQVTLALEFHIHRQAPFAKELAGTTATSDIIYQDLNLHITKAGLFAVKTSPFNNAGTVIIETSTRVAFDINQESDFTRILGAATIAVAVSTLVVNHSINRVATLAESKGF
jgi:hypothetical protein